MLAFFRRLTDSEERVKNVVPILAALLVSSPPAAAYDVVVLQSFESQVYAKAIEGYEQTCGGTVTTYTLGKDKKLAPGDLDAIKRANPAAILALGPSALTEIVQKKPPVPVIFTAVSEKPKDVTTAAGILMTIPMEKQVDTMLKLAPAVRTIGVVYNPAKTQYFVDDLVRSAKARGVEVKTVAASSAQDAVKQLNGLFPTIGAYMFAPDTSVHSAVLEKAALSLSIKHKVPVIGFSPTQCANGALFASELDAVEMGKQAGEVTRQIVEEKRNPTPQYAPIKKYKLHVNPKVADQLGLRIPGDVASGAALCTEAE